MTRTLPRLFDGPKVCSFLDGCCVSRWRMLSCAGCSVDLPVLRRQGDPVASSFWGLASCRGLGVVVATGKRKNNGIVPRPAIFLQPRAKGLLRHNVQIRFMERHFIVRRFVAGQVRALTTLRSTSVDCGGPGISRRNNLASPEGRTGSRYQD